MNDVEDCIIAIRNLWYEENAKDTTNYDAREIAIRVGTKLGYIKAINLLRKMDNERCNNSPEVNG